MRRLSRPVLEHFYPVYDDVYSDSFEEGEDEAIYEEVEPPRKRALVSTTPLPTASYLDLMQVSAVLTDSPMKRLRSEPSTPSQSAYALHGGDWVSIASGIYDDVASTSSDSESDEEFGTGECLRIFQWLQYMKVGSLWPGERRA